MTLDTADAVAFDHTVSTLAATMASLGAKVLHPRSVWYARRYGVRIHVRSSFSYNPGTLVAQLRKEERVKTDKPVTGVALDRNHARIDLLGVPDTPGIAAKVFGALGAAGVSADTIIQGVPGDGSRQTAAVMATVYGGILGAIERNGYDVFRHRAHLTTWQKVKRLPLALRVAGADSDVAGRMMA